MHAPESILKHKTYCSNCTLTPIMRMHGALIAQAALFMIMSLHLPSAVKGDVATAVSYGPPYIPTRCDGSNEEQFPASNMFAAVSEGLWDGGAACGRRYLMRCLSGAGSACTDADIVVQVVDLCSSRPARPCSANFLLSAEAFKAISQSDAPDAKINVEYTQI